MINAYSVDPFTIQRWQSYDKYNNPTFVDQLVKGYIDWKNRRVRNIAGEEVTAVATIYLHKKYCKVFGRPNHKDVIVIGSVKHSIAVVFDGKDFSVNHYEIAIL